MHPATHVVSGNPNGMLVVDVPDTAKLQLVLNGVDITSETSAALYILEADKVFVTLADGTTNTLANGGSFVAVDDNNIDGALFSKQDLTLNGSGVLTVTSPAGHGIVCKDDLVITGATITGGTFIGTGAAGMAQTFSDSDQGVIALQVGSQSAGTEIILKDQNGKTVLSHTPELNFAVVILSCPEMVKGETYTITVGTQCGDFAAS